MSLFKIAWRSIQQRGLASALTALSMALGVMLVVAVLSIHGVVSQSFRNNTSLGYNLIVGAKGGDLQMTLNTVYYLSRPVENIPYQYYLEFTDGAERSSALQHSIRSHIHAAQSEALAAASLTDAAPGLAAVTSLAASQALPSPSSPETDVTRAGKFKQFVSLAIPLCLGDYYGQFRVVGTTPDLFDKLRFGPAADQHYEFAEGRNFRHWSPEHGYFEAVVGARVAREMHVQLGQGISPAHGDPEGAGHAQQFTVVGILAATGTPNDRAVFINIEGFYLMEDHAKPLPKEERPEQPEGPPIQKLVDSSSPEAAASDNHAQRQEPLPVEQREVTAILLKTVNPMVAVGLPTTINEGPEARCVLPIREITNLFAFIVDPLQYTLLVVTALVCLVSGISILVSIYNSMSERRHEIAVMRALGASRGTVMTVILLEAVLLSLLGGGVGWLTAHALNVAASPFIEDMTGVSIGFFDMGSWYVHDVQAQVAKAFSSNGPVVAARIGRALFIAALAAVVGGAVLWLAPGRAVPRLARVGGWGIVGGVLLLVVAVLYRLGIPLNIEMVLIPSLLLLAVVVGFLPAMSAYQTDVAKSLGS